MCHESVVCGYQLLQLGNYKQVLLLRCGSSCLWFGHLASAVVKSLQNVPQEDFIYESQDPQMIPDLEKLEGSKF